MTSFRRVKGEKFKLSQKEIIMNRLAKYENQKANELNSRFGMPTIFDFFSRPISDFSDLFPSGLEDMRMDVKDCGDHYQLKADLPGVKKEDIKVDFNDGNLTISAEHHKSSEKNDKNGYIIKERSSGMYQRSMHFADADAKNINAAFANGELDIRIDKLANENKSTAIVIH